MVSANRSHTSCANVPVSWSLIWFRHDNKRFWNEFWSVAVVRPLKSSKHLILFLSYGFPTLKSRCFPPIFLGSQTTWRSRSITPKSALPPGLSEVKMPEPPWWYGTLQATTPARRFSPVNPMGLEGVTHPLQLKQWENMPETSSCLKSGGLKWEMSVSSQEGIQLFLGWRNDQQYELALTEG